MNLIPRMPLSELIQSIIHKLDVGIGARALRGLTMVLAIAGLALLYNSCAYRNISTPEGMDAAQLARNLAEGKGYTTLFIRPFSLYLVQNYDQKHGRPFGTDSVPDFARVKSPHPDLANPPVYPAALAALMKVLPFHFEVDLKKPFWSEGGAFVRYQPDFIIAMFNESLLLVAVALTFFLARKLFDNAVAWMSLILMLGCELLWRFSTSGLSTMLLLVIFLGLARCLLKIEELAREPQPRPNLLLGFAIVAGLLTGVGGLTRYAFGWAIVPAVLFLAFFSGPRRVRHALTALGMFALVLAPWIIRNWHVCGLPFGTATFAAAENTPHLFPLFQLERSTHPDLKHLLWRTPYMQKFMANLRDILNNDILKLGGSWTSVLFITGLFLGFRNAATRRMRYFLLLCLGTFVLVQTLGRTQLSVETPELNSENLLILLAPLVFIYSAAMFFTLLDQMALTTLVPVQFIRAVIIGGFAIVACLPMIFVLLPPKTNPVVYPPYYPPYMQTISGWMNKNELVMSDVPWAVAWYGNQQCVWLTLNVQDEYYALNDYIKPVSALYLTPKTMNGRFETELHSDEASWGDFIIQATVQRQIPPDFPLRIAPGGYFPGCLFLTDRERWKLNAQ